MFRKRRPWVVLTLALAGGALVGACGGSEEAAPAAEVEQSQSQAEAEPAAQPREQAEAADEPGAAEQAEATAVAQAEETEQAQASEEAVDEGEASEAESSEAGADEEEAGDVESSDGGEKEGSVDPVALLSQLFLADLSSLSDYRFTAILELSVSPEDPDNRGFELITALGGFRFSGVVVPPDTFELTIAFGRSGAGGLPPFGIVQTGGALYTSFGFGWELQPAEAELGELASVLVEIDAFGFDIVAILEAIAEQGRLPASTEAGAFPIEVLQEALEPLGAAEVEGRAVQRYRIDDIGLSEIIRAIVDPRLLEEQLGLDGIYGGIRDADIVLSVAEEDGLLLRVVADLRNPNVDTDSAGDDAGASPLAEFRIETLHFEMDVDAELGVPVRILIEMPAFEVYGEAGYAGSMRLEITIEDLNAGNVRVEPPI